MQRLPRKKPTEKPIYSSIGRTFAHGVGILSCDCERDLPVRQIIIFHVCQRFYQSRCLDQHVFTILLLTIYLYYPKVSQCIQENGNTKVRFANPVALFLIAMGFQSVEFSHLQQKLTEADEAIG